MQASYKVLDKCLICKSTELKEYLDLGTQPLANSFHQAEDKLESYPLAIHYCQNCYHSQLSVAVNPDLLFKNYLYVSGTTRTLVSYFTDFARKLAQKHPSAEVLEIACNDGSLMQEMRSFGLKVTGVDPAENLMKYSADKNLQVIQDYWSLELATKLGKKFDVIVAMNVLAHNADPVGFMRACREVLNPKGSIYIQTSQSEIFKNFEFDTIYHEHHSFFTARSFAKLAEQAGLQINSAEKVKVHGSSYLIEFCLSGESDKTFDKLLAQETTWAYYQPQTYVRFGDQARERVSAVIRLVDQYKKQGYRLFAYGAAAKGNTFLNFAKLQDMEAIIDDNELKWGLETPGMNIPVCSVRTLQDIQEPLCVVVLAWNFFEEVLERLQKVRTNPYDIAFAYFGPSTKPRSINSLSSVHPTL